MKKIIYLIGLSLSLSSCIDNVLNKRPLDMIGSDLVFKDEALMESYLASQYTYTPVLVGDATTVFQSFDQNPINVSTVWEFNMGNSEQADGPFLSMDLSDETGILGAPTGLWRNPGVKQYGITKDGGYMEYWELPYKTIRNLNEFIEKAPNSNMNEDKKKLRIAEARFLRAFNYFAMVKRYGGVPLIIETLQMDDSNEKLYPKRDKEKEIYDFIINEMEDIYNDLENANEIGRANKWAAKALACRAALYAGSIAKYGTIQLDGIVGIPADQAQTYFQKAYDLAVDIRDNSPYNLYQEDADKVTNFQNIFLKKNNCEAIFVVQHDGINAVQNGGHAWSWDFLQCPKPHAENGGNRNMPYLDFIEEFENADGTPNNIRDYIDNGSAYKMNVVFGGKDPRFYASIWTNETLWQGDIIDMHKGMTGVCGYMEGINDSWNGINAWGNQNIWYNLDTGFGVKKYLNENTNNTIWFSQSSTDYLVFRFGEILLNLAEAAFELGNTQDAFNAIKAIRDRAGIQTNFTSSNITMEIIRHERKVELAFENHRYWDLRRWRTAQQELSKNWDGLRFFLYIPENQENLELGDRYYIMNSFKFHGTERPPQFKSENYYFPITTARRNANPNLIENPGY